MNRTFDDDGTTTLWCEECGDTIDYGDEVWVDPESGKATMDETGRSYHVGCAPNERDYDVPIRTRYGG